MQALRQAYWKGFPCWLFGLDVVWPHHSFYLSFKRRSPGYISRDVPRFLGQGFKLVQLTWCLTQMHGVYLPKICHLDHNAVERASKGWGIWVSVAGQRETTTAGISRPNAHRGTIGTLVYCCCEPTPHLATSYCQKQILLVTGHPRWEQWLSSPGDPQPEYLVKDAEPEDFW